MRSTRRLQSETADPSAGINKNAELQVNRNTGDVIDGDRPKIMPIGHFFNDFQNFVHIGIF
jgi:hypothetical protein